MYESKSVGNASLIYSCHFIFFYRVMFGKEFLTGKSVRGEIAVQCLLCVNIK